MKHIGIVGITAEGAALCYKTIVSEAATILGINKHPEISINTSSFDQILECQIKKDWGGVAKIILKSIRKLKKAGANFCVIPANSIHFAIDQIKNKSVIPVLDLVEMVTEECRNKHFKKVGVLGVGITMADGLYNQNLKKIGIEPAIPDVKDQELLNNIIYSELVLSRIEKTSIKSLLNIIENLKLKGCDGLILACTELPMVINDDNSPLPLIDSTRLLAKKALEYAIEAI